MEIISKLSEDALKISLVGELDANGAINLDRIIRKAIADGYYKIAVDCRQLEYISSAGLGVFISYISELKSHNGKFVFYHLRENVESVFNILGLQKVVAITHDFTQAKNQLHEV